MNKKINVKITANTSKFKKAISDANKSLDKMKKSSDKISKSKIDKNLSKQFNNITKSSKKVDKQLKQNTKSLNNINKTKLSNITKQFSNMDKTVKDNQKTLQTLQKTLNNLKAKSIESVNKALTTMSKGASTVSKSLSNVKNVLISVSTKTIEALTRSITTLNNKCPAVSNGFNNIKNKINGIKTGVFGTLSSKLDTVKSKASDAGNKFKNLKTRISDTAKQTFQKLVDSTTRLNTEGTKSSNIFTNFSNKVKSLTSGALGGLNSKLSVVTSSATKMSSTFATTAVIGSAVFTKLSNKVNDTTSKYNSNKDAMLNAVVTQQKLATDTAKLAEEYKKLSKAIDKNFNDSEKLREAENLDAEAIRKNREETAKLTKKKEELDQKERKLMQSIDQNVKKYADLSQKDKTLEKELRSLVDKYNELAKAQGKATLNFDKLVNGEQKVIRGTKTLRSATGNLREELKNAAKYTINLSNEQKKAEKTTKSFGDKMKDLSKSLKDTFEKLNKGDFSGAFSSLKDAGKAAFALMPGWVKAATALVIVLKKLYDAGKKRFFEGLDNIKNALQPVMNTVNTFVRSLRTAIETVTGARFDLASNIAGVIEFDYAIQRAGATCKASQEQIVQLSDKARELGASTKFSSAEVADAFYYMALAGWDTTSMLDAIDDVLQLSNVSGMDLAKTCDIVTDYLSTFGRSSKDAADFCNYMAATSTSTNTTVEQLAEAYNQCAGAASEFGVTQSFLNTQLGILANSGKKSGPAGVVLKNMYTNLLSPPSDDAFAAYKKWGVYVGEKLNPALTRTNELTGEQQLNGEALTKQLKKQYKAYTDVSDKAKMLKMIYGKLALSGGAILLGAKDFDYERLELVQKTSDSFGAYLNKQNKIINGEGKLVNANGKVINSMEDIDDVTRKSIDTFKEQYQVYEDFKDAQIADVLGTTNTDIATTITMLGEAGITGAKRVEQFINVVEAIKNPTKKVESAVKNAGLSMDKFSKSLKYNKDGSLDLAGTMDNLLPILSKVEKPTRDLMLKNMGLGNSIDEVDELIKNGKGSWSQRKKDIESVQTATEKMVEYFNGTLKDKLKGTMSALAEMFISAIYPCKEQITEVIDSFTHFFAAIGNIIKNNGKSTTQDLINISKDWKKWLTDGITNAISGLKNFVTGGGLDTVLTIGTNIITGICDGIIKNKESLTTAISEAIRKICDWIIENGPKIQEAGSTILTAIGDGIQNNKSKLSMACDTIFSVINAWVSGHEAVIGKLGAAVGWALIKGAIVGFGQKISNFYWTIDAWLGNTGVWLVSNGAKLGVDLITGIGNGLWQGFVDFCNYAQDVVDNIINWFKAKFGIHSPSTVMADEVGQYLITGIGRGILDHIGDFFDMLGGLKDKIVNFFKDLFGMGDKNENPFSNLDASKAKELDKALQSLSDTAQACQKNLSIAFSGLRDSLKTSFVSCTNITRTQFINIKNIISNQVSAARNIATSKMISINKVISTQSSAARNNATRNFISLRKVIQTQMSEAYRSVSSYMSKIKSATNQNLHTKINVTKTVETVKKDSNASSLSFANFAKLSSMATNKSLSYASLSTSGIGGDIGSNNGNSSSKPTIIHNYIDLDGKIVAKQTAKYMDGELTILNNKNNRKRGTR